MDSMDSFISHLAENMRHNTTGKEKRGTKRSLGKYNIQYSYLNQNMTTILRRANLPLALAKGT